MTDPPPVYTAGISIETNHHDGPGTLGGFGRDATGRPVLLSCSHVLFPGFQAAPTTQVFTPDYGSTCCGGDPIARPTYDPGRAAKGDGAGKYYGGYRDGAWTGGFDSVPARVNIMGSNVPGNASRTDCAAARLAPGTHFRNVWQITRDGTTTTIPLKGAVPDGDLGVVKGPPLGTAPTTQQYVRIYSANHGVLQYGTLLSTPPDMEHVDDPDHLIYRFGISYSDDENTGARPSVNQFLVLPRPTPRPGMSYVDTYKQNERLSIHQGQSGSFVINHENLVIGMVIREMDPTQYAFDTSSMEMRDVKRIGVVTPIAAVLEALAVTIPADVNGWSGTVPATSVARVTLAGPAPTDDIRRRAVRRLRADLATSVRGRLLLGLVGRHKREVRRVLTTVRPAVVGWRALQGPAYHHHAMRSVERADHRIPDRINGIGRADLVAGVLALLQAHGSDALRHDLARYGPLFTAALADLTSVHDAPDALARPAVRV